MPLLKIFSRESDNPPNLSSNNNTIHYKRERWGITKEITGPRETITRLFFPFRYRTFLPKPAKQKQKQKKTLATPKTIPVQSPPAIPLQNKKAHSLHCLCKPLLSLFERKVQKNVFSYNFTVLVPFSPLAFSLPLAPSLALSSFSTERTTTALPLLPGTGLTTHRAPVKAPRRRPSPPPPSPEEIESQSRAAAASEEEDDERVAAFAFAFAFAFDAAALAAPAEEAASRTAASAAFPTASPAETRGASLSRNCGERGAPEEAEREKEGGAAGDSGDRGASWSSAASSALAAPLSTRCLRARSAAASLLAAAAARLASRSWSLVKEGGGGGEDSPSPPPAPAPPPPPPPPPLAASSAAAPASRARSLFLGGRGSPLEGSLSHPATPAAPRAPRRADLGTERSGRRHRSRGEGRGVGREGVVVSAAVPSSAIARECGSGAAERLDDGRDGRSQARRRGRRRRGRPRDAARGRGGPGGSS